MDRYTQMCMNKHLIDVKVHTHMYRYIHRCTGTQVDIHIHIDVQVHTHIQVHTNIYLSLHPA